MALSESASYPGAKHVIRSKQENVARVDTIKERSLRNTEVLGELSLYAEQLAERQRLEQRVDIRILSSSFHTLFKQRLDHISKLGNVL